MFAEGLSPEILSALRHVSVEDVLLPVLVQLTVIILAARLFARAFRRIGQPAVVGEIAAGLVLGPSLLGWAWKDASDLIFHPTLAGVPPELADQLFRLTFTTLSQVGLVFLLFLVGLEFDFTHLRGDGKSALAISLAGIALPFALGVILAPLLLATPGLQPDGARPLPPVGFTLFLGTALAITALPVLGRMLMDYGITRTRLAAVVISAAAVGDAAGWIILATVTGVVRAELELGDTARMVALTLGFGVVMLFGVRPLMRWWARREMRRNGGQLSVTGLAVLLGVVFACSIATNLIGIFAIFGAFLLGAVLSDEHEFREAVSARLHDFVTAFFVPVFFTYTGLRTNIGTLATPELWGLCLLVLAAAVGGKLIGCGVAARLTGFPRREAACVGAMMNTRGLMELVVVNLGKDLGVVPDSVYCMLVLMAVVTTVMTTPLLWWLTPGTELGPHFRRAEPLSPSPPK